MSLPSSTTDARAGTPDWLTSPIEFEDHGSFRLSRAALRSTITIAAVALLWAGLAPVRELSVARGQLMPASQVRPVQHLEGGIVEEILAEQGQVVEKDQPLMRLRAVTAESELAALHVRALNLQLQKERVEALIAGRPANFRVFGKARPTLIAEYEQAYQLRVDHRIKERRLLMARIAQRRAEVAALQGEVGIQRRLMEIQRQQLEARRHLVIGGSVSTKQVLEVETAFEQARVLLQGSEGKLAAGREALAEAEAALAESDAQAQKQSGEELAKSSSELVEVRETIRKHADRVERLIVRAPARGSVQHVLQRSPGEVVRPGETIAQIVPIGEALVAEVHVKTEDIAFVKAGQAAELKVTAYDFSKYGKVKGEVASISPSTFELGDKRSYYKVVIRLDPHSNAAAAAGWKLQPGMTVEADIISGSRSLLQYLLKPVYRSIDVAFSER
jgi:HlyD family secretion protein/adhesin transport system membrane fusion protein